MIDSDLVDSLAEHEARTLKQAIVTVANSGILQMQEARLLLQLASGPDSQAIFDLGESILAYRRKVQSLRELLELGDQFRNELERGHRL